MIGRDNLPPLGWLRSFEASARHLSFTGAARELNMTQSAVSQQIKSLEHHLNLPLFRRHPRSLSLTEAGMVYLPIVREAFQMLLHGTRSLSGGSPSVTLYSNLAFSVFWLAPRLSRFQRKHPDISLNIVTDIWEPKEVAQTADVEIRFCIDPPQGVSATRLTRDSYFPVSAPDYDVTLETLQSRPLLDVSFMVGNWMNWCDAAGITWDNPTLITASTFAVVLEMAESGAGVAIAHDTVAKERIAQGRLIVPFDVRPPLKEAYYLLERDTGGHDADTQLFVNWLKSELHLGA